MDDTGMAKSYATGREDDSWYLFMVHVRFYTGHPVKASIIGSQLMSFAI